MCYFLRLFHNVCYLQRKVFGPADEIGPCHWFLYETRGEIPWKLEIMSVLVACGWTRHGRLGFADKVLSTKTASSSLCILYIIFNILHCDFNGSSFKYLFESQFAIFIIITREENVPIFQKCFIYDEFKKD